MAFPKKSLVECRHLTPEAVMDLYDLARRSESFDIRDASRRIAALVFLEPSTRTRSSFQVAGHRIGVETFLLEGAGSSLEKGESIQDTLLNLNAMDVDLFVVRHGDSAASLSKIAPLLNAPVISAGEGSAGHPTQALLDVFTLCETRKIRNPLELRERVLFVGDIIHSRVARSNFELLKVLKIPFAIAAPAGWVKNTHVDLAQEWDIPHFKTLDEGLKWATVVMALRAQKERHQSSASSPDDETVLRFQLNEDSLRVFSKEGLILHPGPVNWDVELSKDVQKDSRNLILKQVSYGVQIRAALMARLMELV